MTKFPLLSAKHTNRKIKILQFPIANSFGGITHYAIDNWKWMNKDIFQCDFATMSKSLFFASELEKTGSKIYYISCYAEENKEQFIKEFNSILDNGYDIVHLHTKQWKSFLVEELCKKYGVPKVIVHSHSSQCDNNDEEIRAQETEEHYRVRALFNETLATDFWACSELAADWLFGKNISAKKIKIIKNAIETEKFLFNKKLRADLRQKYNLENKYAVGNVGRLVYQKNHSFLLDVFASVCQIENNAVLMIVGDGELENALRKQADRLGIASKVMFLGKCTNVNELYNMMDLFVLPSNFEGLPITLVEAQANGLKCIASNVITREVVLSENIEFYPLEKSVWAKAILEKICEPYERADMRKIVESKGFDSEKQIQVICDGYLKNIYGGGVYYSHVIIFACINRKQPVAQSAASKTYRVVAYSGIVSARSAA